MRSENDLLENGIRDSRCQNRNHQCNRGHTCSDRIHSYFLQAAFIEQHEILHFEPVNRTPIRVGNRHRHQNQTRLDPESRILRRERKGHQ